MTLDFAALRRTMVEGQLRTYDVSDARLIAAIEAVPREDFVPESPQGRGLVDQPITLSGERIMLTPMVFARLCRCLRSRRAIVFWMSPAALVIPARCWPRSVPM